VRRICEQRPLRLQREQTANHARPDAFDCRAVGVDSRANGRWDRRLQQRFGEMRTHEHDSLAAERGRTLEYRLRQLRTHRSVELRDVRDHLEALPSALCAHHAQNQQHIHRGERTQLRAAEVVKDGTLPESFVIDREWVATSRERPVRLDAEEPGDENILLLVVLETLA